MPRALGGHYYGVEAQMRRNEIVALFTRDVNRGDRSEKFF
jgi:hypothetical protein